MLVVVVGVELEVEVELLKVILVVVVAVAVGDMASSGDRRLSMKDPNSNASERLR